MLRQTFVWKLECMKFENQGGRTFYFPECQRLLKFFLIKFPFLPFQFCGMKKVSEFVCVYVFIFALFLTSGKSCHLILIVMLQQSCNTFLHKVMSRHCSKIRPGPSVSLLSPPLSPLWQHPVALHQIGLSRPHCLTHPDTLRANYTTNN